MYTLIPNIFKICPPGLDDINTTIYQSK